jgi:hypothetical protein
LGRICIAIIWVQFLPFAEVNTSSILSVNWQTGLVGLVSLASFAGLTGMPG